MLNTNQTPDQQIETLKAFLLRRGIDPFWANSALSWVRRALAGNTHFVTDLRYPQLTENKEYKGVIKRLSLSCTLHSVSDRVSGKIIYTFRPGRGGHRIIVKAI